MLAIRLLRKFKGWAFQRFITRFDLRLLAVALAIAVLELLLRKEKEEVARFELKPGESLVVVHHDGSRIETG